jgi:hypothetical protein
MEWTQENVIEFMELYKRKEIIWNPKHPMHFNKIGKQDAWENWEKKSTDPSMGAKRKWRTYCHLSDGRKLSKSFYFTFWKQFSSPFSPLPHTIFHRKHYAIYGILRRKY